MSERKSFCYDVECYPNLFTISMEHIYSDEVKQFVIYHDPKGIHSRNDYPLICDMFENHIKTAFGYHNSEYDDLLVKHLLFTKDFFKTSDALNITKSLKILSDKIINNQNKKGKQNTDYINNLRSKKAFGSFDLLRLFNTINRVGLKQIAINLRMPIIEDLPFKESDYILPDQIEKVLNYNLLVDVKTTKALLLNREPLIMERKEFSQMYKTNVINENDTNIAKILLRKYYCEATGFKFEDFKNKRTFYTHLELKECISKKVSFETEAYQKAVIAYRKAKINPNKLDDEEKKSKKKQFEFILDSKYTTHTLGLGGIHSNNLSEILTEGSDYDLIDADVTSWYPRLLIVLGLHPAHLDKRFTQVYADKIFHPRVAAKKAGNKILAEFLKIAANSTFGLTKSMYSWLYDPKMAMRITINGQLFLMMLMERIEQHTNCVVVYSNTDGLTVKVPHSEKEKFFSICKQWQEYIGCELEYSRFKRMVIKDVNNYFISTYSEDPDKQFKKKGDFVTKPPITSGYSYPIVAKALHEYYANDVNPEYTIHSCTDIFEFIKAERTSIKKFEIRFRKISDPYKLELLNKSNRWIITKGNKDEGKLVKFSFKKQIEVQMQKDRYVTLVNDLTTVLPLKEYNLDYQFYLNEVYTIIRAIKQKTEIKAPAKQLHLL